MKFLKILLKCIAAFLLIFLLIVLVVLFVDNHNTSYLNINNNEQANANSYWLENVNIIPMHQDTVLLGKVLHIENGRIEAIEDSVPSGVTRMDASGKYLLPGLIDMHVHVWDRYELGLYLANGVTAIRNLWGMPFHLRIKNDIRNDKLLAPYFYTSGPKLTGPEFIGGDNLQLLSPEKGREKVREYKIRGYDFIKTYYGITQNIFDAVLEESTIQGMDIAAHPSQKVSYASHFRAPVRTLEHAEEIVQQPLRYTLDTLQLIKVVALFAESKNTSFCPTLIGYHNIYEMLINDSALVNESAQYINPMIRLADSEKQYKRWQTTKANDSNIVHSIASQHNFHLFIVRKMHEAGVNIVCGTDAGIGITVAGNSIHQELAFYKQAGLSNYEVLQTATRNPSETHVLMRNMGTIERGKLANFVLLHENPLENLETLKEPHAVCVQGRILDGNTLAEYKRKALDRSNLLATALRYAENMWVEK